MTPEQKRVLEKMEAMVERWIAAGKVNLADQWIPVLEACWAGDFVWAALEMSMMKTKIDMHQFIEEFRKIFDIRKIY